MESEILVGRDFNRLAQLLSAADTAGLEATKISYYKFLLVQSHESFSLGPGKMDLKSSLILLAPGSMGIKLLDLSSKKGYWCIVSERWFIQYTNLKLITVKPLFSHDTDQIFFEKSDHSLEKLFKIMLRESESGNIHKYDVIFNCIALLLLEAIKRLPVNSHDNEFNAAVGLYQAFLYLLDDRFKNPEYRKKSAMVKPSYFSGLLAVDNEFLNKVVLKFSGKNIIELINEQLMRRAKTFLSSSGNSITEIAESLGFESTAQFQQLFKKNAGLAPSAFRRNTKHYRL